MKQKTLAQSISIKGIGLHSGKQVTLNLHPAEENTGICFCRTDLSPREVIRIHPDLINDTRLSSTIVTKSGIRIGTIEHLMSALYGAEIDNILIEVDAPEIPIMDGSSLFFLSLIHEAGVVNQNHPRRLLKIISPVEIEYDDKKARIEPHDGFQVALTIDFKHPLFSEENQKIVINFSKQSYLDEIAPARTFGFLKEIESMRRQNLGLGGSLDNAIVITDTGILNSGGLRYPNEFVRHKVLDAIGDLYILGHPIIGFFSGYKSGHAINNMLLRKILNQPSCYEWVNL